MSEANARAEGDDGLGVGISVRSLSQIRRDESRDRAKGTSGWYGTGKSREYRASARWKRDMDRPEWAKVAPPWNVPDYLKVSATPKDSAGTESATA